MSNIFISYAKEDRESARKLARVLEAEGWEVFWDRNIPTGKTWRDIIETKLKAAQCLVVLWSKASISSHWVLEEAEKGRQRGILIPVLIENVEQPLGFQSLQAADLSNWDGTSADVVFTSLVSDITTTVSAAATDEQVEEERKRRALEKAAPEFGQINEPIPGTPRRVTWELKRLWLKFWNLKRKAKVLWIGAFTGTLLFLLIAGFDSLSAPTQERLKIKLHLWPQPFTEDRGDDFNQTLDGKPNPRAWKYPPGQWKIERDINGGPSSGILTIFTSKWGVRNDLDSKAFYDFKVKFRVQFKKGNNKAAWVLRAQEDGQRGYVFELERRDLKICLNAWVYTGKETIPIGDTPNIYLVFDGPFVDEDYFDVDADVVSNTFKYTVTWGTTKAQDDQGHDRILSTEPYSVPLLKDEQSYYRYGNIGFFAPEGNQAVIDEYSSTALAAAGSSPK